MFWYFQRLHRKWFTSLRQTKSRHCCLFKTKKTQNALFGGRILWVNEQLFFLFLFLYYLFIFFMENCLFFSMWRTSLRTMSQLHQGRNHQMDGTASHPGKRRLGYEIPQILAHRVSLDPGALDSVHLQRPQIESCWPTQCKISPDFE